MVDTAPREPALEVAVSWIGDGTFTGTYDDITDRLLAGTLRARHGRDTARPLGRPMVPDAGWQSDNHDRLLSPEYAGSDLYQLVEPGKPFRQRVTIGAEVDYDDPDVSYDADIFYDGQETLYLASGQLEEPQHNPALGVSSVEFTGLGNLSKLQGRKLSTALYTSIRTDQAITVILDAVGWSPSLRRIAPGDTTLEFWWLDDEDAFNALDDIVASEGAPAYLGEDPDNGGTFVFENRNYRSTEDRCLTSQILFSDHFSADTDYEAPIDYDADVFYEGGAEYFHSGITYRAGFDEIYNHVTLPIVRRVEQSSQKVWEYGAPLVLTAGESRLVTVSLSDPITSPIAPASGTDYTLGAGTLASTPTLESVNAQRLGIRFVAGGGGATVNGVTSNGPQLRAKPVTVVSESVEQNSVDTSDSIAKRGIRSLELSARQEMNPAFAIALCDAVATYYQDPKPQIEVVVKNIDGNHLVQQVMRKVSDRITVVSEPLGLNGDMWIEQKSSQRNPGELEVTLTCTRAPQAADVGVWDDGLWDDAAWAA